MPPKTKWPPNTKLNITHSFLELQSPGFAWKFVWTVRTNFEDFFKNKMAAKSKNKKNVKSTKN